MFRFGAAPGMITSDRAATTAAPMTFVVTSIVVSRSWTRTRSWRGVWSAGPSNHEPNAVRRLAISASICHDRSGRSLPDSSPRGPSSSGAEG
jgi:hypothetical protein